jgi:hypothetical protein
MEFTRTVSALPRGTALSRYLMALSLNDPLLAIEMAKENWPDTPQVLLTLRAGVDAGGLFTTWGSQLAMYGIGQELIEALRPATIVDRLAPFMRKCAFRTKTARETTVAAAAWVGEKAPTPATSAAFDLVTIDPTKCAALVVLSKDLVHFSNPSAEVDLRNQLVRGIARFLDTQLLDPTVAPVTGINPGALTYGAVAQTSSGATAAQIMADLLAMLGNLATQNAPFASPFWIMRPITAIALAGKYNTAGAIAFPDIKASPLGGMLLGIPVLNSASSPQQITLLDASEMLLADDGLADLQSTDEASIQMDSTPALGAQSAVSLFQNNLFALRGLREITWAPAHADGSPPTPRAITYMTTAY